MRVTVESIPCEEKSNWTLSPSFSFWSWSGFALNPIVIAGQPKALTGPWAMVTVPLSVFTFLIVPVAVAVCAAYLWSICMFMPL